MNNCSFVSADVRKEEEVYVQDERKFSLYTKKEKKKKRTGVGEDLLPGERLFGRIIWYKLKFLTV